MESQTLIDRIEKVKRRASSAANRKLTVEARQAEIRKQLVNVNDELKAEGIDPDNLDVEIESLQAQLETEASEAEADLDTLEIQLDAAEEALREE